MPSDKVENIVIGLSDSNQRLDKWLLSHYPNLNNSMVQKLIRTKQVKVDGKGVAHNYVLQVGQSVRIPVYFISQIETSKKPKKAVDTAKYQKEIVSLVDSVIYKDDNLLILNKPAGIAVQGGSGVDFHVSVALPFLRFELDSNPLIVHRIDKDTSGILILARHKLMAQYMFHMFKEKQISKTYVCLTHPFILKKYQNMGFEGVISAPLLKEGDGVSISENGKEAVSLYKVLDYNGDIALMEVSPQTGRTHQIRVHMSEYLGNPIVGDFKYGAKPLKEKGINYRRMYLHAKSVEFISIDDEQISVEAPLDEDFVDTLNKLNLKRSEPL
ncbi:MAG: RluA family pseudouridine synthase [Alphaproteobacteria bacterium]|jgi:23S rRNA pseudouridine955/2504/2580 synthase|nr:RluA family pseudouridine synthase [Alphaproteobacteria bacterium]